jgi:hypothetical protein
MALAPENMYAAPEASFQPSFMPLVAIECLNRHRLAASENTGLQPSQKIAHCIRFQK